VWYGSQDQVTIPNESLSGVGYILKDSVFNQETKKPIRACKRGETTNHICSLKYQSSVKSSILIFEQKKRQNLVYNEYLWYYSIATSQTVKSIIRILHYDTLDQIPPWI